jgi:hypothetical protein
MGLDDGRIIAVVNDKGFMARLRVAGNPFPALSFAASMVRRF